MPKPSIRKALNPFLNAVDYCIRILNDSPNYYLKSNGTYNPITIKERNSIIEIGFLVLYINWESFLEESFIRFLRGAKTTSGRLPKTYIRPTNLNHAYGIVKKGGRYVDWTKPEDIIKFSKLYFKNGEPYASVINSISGVKKEMNTIRNKIVHSSRSADKEFNKLLRRMSILRSVPPGAFLLLTKPDSGNEYLQYYASTLKIASIEITR